MVELTYGAKLSRGRRFSSTKYVMYTFKIYIGGYKCFYNHSNLYKFPFFWQEELIADKWTSVQTHSRPQDHAFQVLSHSGASGRAPARPSSFLYFSVCIGSVPRPPACIKRLEFPSRYVRHVPESASESVVPFTHNRTF